MTTLTTAPLAPLLDRLFAEADQASARTDAAVADLSPEERLRMMRSKTDYRDLYGRLKDLPLAVSRETGALIYMLARSSRARAIVEFGTSFGISTLYLAAALRDNGGGRLITTEFEPSKVARARKNLTAAGLIDLVEIRAGDALKTLKTGLPETIDLLLLDGAKALYPDVLALLEERLRPSALIVADDADVSAEYLKRVRSPANGYMSVAFAEDVELSMRISRRVHPALDGIGGNSGASSPANGSRQAGVSISRAFRASTRGKSLSGRPARSANGRTQATRKSA
jgi:predicted O-methyltransferase YrrM